jgi:hypothetical protein
MLKLISYLLIITTVAYGMNDFNGRVNFLSSEANPSRPINPYTNYSSYIRYYVSDYARTMTITVNDHEYTVNMLDVVQEAMREWQRFLGRNITFIPTSSEGTADLLFTINPELPSARQFVLGVAELKGPTLPRSKVTFYDKSFNKLIASSTFVDRVRQDMSSDTSISEIFNTMLKWVAKHEIGHTLGYSHPDFGRRDDTISVMRGNVTVLMSYRDNSTPIMITNFIEYMDDLHRRLNRHVMYQDVGISPQEGVAMDILRDATHNNCSCCSISRIRKSNSCPQFQYSNPSTSVLNLLLK